LISESRLGDKFTFWDPLSGKEKKGEVDLGEPGSWTLSLDGKTLALLEPLPSERREPRIQVWDLNNNRKLRRLESTVKRIHSLALSADGALLASGGKENSIVQVWNVTSGKEVGSFGQNLNTEYKWFVKSLTFSPDGKMLVVKRMCLARVVIGIDPRDPTEIYFFDLVTGRELDRFNKFRKWCEWVAFSPDSKTMVTTAESSAYHLFFWDVASAKELAWVETKEKSLTAVFSPDGRTLVSGMEDGSVLLWEVSTRKIRRTLMGHRGPVHHLTFSDDGQLLASQSSDGTALIWDMHNGASQKGN
jgi:WD40 repeat protein